jgi:hypothetical protein
MLVVVIVESCERRPAFGEQFGLQDAAGGLGLVVPAVGYAIGLDFFASDTLTINTNLSIDAELA